MYSRLRYLKLNKFLKTEHKILNCLLDIKKLICRMKYVNNLRKKKKKTRETYFFVRSKKRYLILNAERILFLPIVRIPDI